MPRSAKEKAEIEFFVPETFRICELFIKEKMSFISEWGAAVEQTTVKSN